MAVINDKVTCMSLSKNLVSPSGSDRSPKKKKQQQQKKHQPKKTAKRNWQEAKKVSEIVVLVEIMCSIN